MNSCDFNCNQGRSCHCGLAALSADALEALYEQKYRQRVREPIGVKAYAALFGVPAVVVLLGLIHYFN